MKSITFRCDAHVESLSEISRQQAGRIITAYPYEHDAIIPASLKFFDEPVSGMVEIDYPLATPDAVEIKEAKSVGELLWDIAQGYKRIYKEEDETAKIPASNESERTGLINREKTNGVHGIWGHDIGDLFIEGVEIKENGVITLQMGS